MKTAVCFFGQYRTAEYCMPWITSMLDCLPDNVVCVDTQVEQSYTSVALRPEHSQATPSLEAARLLNELPGLVRSSIDLHAQRVYPNTGHWHYAPMFRSMYRVFSAYEAWAVKKGHVDRVVLARLDSLIGPTPDCLHFALSRATDDFTVYSDQETFRFNTHELGLGVGDLCMAGSPASIAAVVHKMTECLFVSPTKGCVRYITGPNIQLKRVIDSCSLKHKSMPVRVALVRPTSDLSMPVMSSFEYHDKFWRQHHPGISK